MIRPIAIFTIVFIISIFLFQSSFFWDKINSIQDGLRKPQARAQEQAGAYTYTLPLPKSKTGILKAGVALAAITPAATDGTLIISKLTIKVPIVFDVPDNQKSVLANLEKGVVHYADSPRPGEKGTAVILGHSSSYPWYRGLYGHVFSTLNKLDKGDIFSINAKDGTALNYKVESIFTFSPNSKDDAKIKAIEQSQQNGVVLLTCWPIGTNLHRIAVYAIQE